MASSSIIGSVTSVGYRHEFWCQPGAGRRLLLRPDVPVGLPDVGVDPRGPGPNRPRHHLAVLLARGGEPARRSPPSLGAHLGLRVQPDAGGGLAAPAGPARTWTAGTRRWVRPSTSRGARPTSPRCTANCWTRSGSGARCSTRRWRIRPPPTRCGPTTRWWWPRAASGSPRWCSPTARRCSARWWPRRCSGAEAERLWDLTVGWLEFPHLYEMQRPKTTDDLRHIGGVFRPYLDARAWPTIANPTR